MGCEEPLEGILFYFDRNLGEDPKIFTDYNLRRRGYTILDWCCMCQCSGEMIDHCTFKDLESLGNKLLASFVGTFFYWSQVWGFTSSDSIPMYIDYLFPCT